MIFSELYSAYYNAVAEILSLLADGVRDEKALKEAVSRHAFGESAMTVLPSLKSGEWMLLRPDLTTPIRHRPTMPLTALQKRWLKSVTLDPRFKLFGVEIEGLSDVEPLFTPEDYVVYDKYADGDPYTDEGYASRFKIILSAIREKTPLRIKMRNRKGEVTKLTVMPKGLEYSEKDDKFRLITESNRFGYTVNLGKIISCEPLPEDEEIALRHSADTERELTLLLYDERNALERVMLHFAHLEKQAVRLDENNYRLTLRYDKNDETELVIRVLSFGPNIKVESPKSFIELIKDRLNRQKSCNLQ